MLSFLITFLQEIFTSQEIASSWLTSVLVSLLRNLFDPHNLDSFSEFSLAKSKVHILIGHEFHIDSLLFLEPIVNNRYKVSQIRILFYR